MSGAKDTELDIPANTRGPRDVPGRHYVEPRVLVPELPPEGFALAGGGRLKELVIAYEMYGELNAELTNAVLICAPLTMDAHAAGWYSDGDPVPGWWDDMIGPGKPLDTDRWCVLSTNMLGGCRGTTGPASINPDTGRPYGASFPDIRLEDIVAVQEVLIRGLGISKLAAVIGGSLGGMQALQWSIAYPQMVEKCVSIAAAPHLSPQALGFKIVGRKVLLNDPAFRGGDYYQGGDGPDKGLAFARMIGLLTYISAESMLRKFGREKNDRVEPGRFETGYQVESYLDYNARKFTRRFDANSYLHLTYAMDTFDLAAAHGSLEKAFGNTHSEFLLVGLSSDWLFPTTQSRELCRLMLGLGKIVSLVEIDSPHGHDGFLLETASLGTLIEAFVNAEGAAPGPGQPAGPRSLGVRGEEGEGRDLSGRPRPPADGAVAVDSRLGGQGKKGGAGAGDSGSRSRVSEKPEEYRVLMDLIEPGSHILDIGCGQGDLIDDLYRAKGVTGFGIDIDVGNVAASLRRNVPVIHGDVDNGLNLFDDGAFDCAVLSQTLQMLKRPRFVLKEILRVAKSGIIVFPNFASWRSRWTLAVGGIMPVSPDMPFRWWESPNIHLFTYRDFAILCGELGIRIDRLVPLARNAGVGRWLLKLGWVNAGADVVVVKVSRT